MIFMGSIPAAQLRESVVMDAWIHHWALIALSGRYNLMPEGHQVLQTESLYRYYGTGPSVA